MKDCVYENIQEILRNRNENTTMETLLFNNFYVIGT